MDWRRIAEHERTLWLKEKALKERAEQERDLLRQAVEAYPEWLETDAGYTCPVCHIYWAITWIGNTTERPPMTHFLDCLRQRALGISKGD